jgi:hypothetical protein
MSRKSKLLSKIRQNPKNVKFNELSTFLGLCGYKLRPPKSGSHRWFFKHGCEPIHFPEHRPIGTVYIKRLLEILESNGSLDDEQDTFI